MPNKAITFKMDVLPNTGSTYNLGDSTKKWLVNGYVVNEASAKEVDSSISAASTSANLPTSQAVAAFVEGKGYDNIKQYDDYDDFPHEGNTAYIYIDKTTNEMYRWSGTAYIIISNSDPTAITNNEIDTLFT